MLKIKLGGEGDADRIAAIRTAVPQTELIVDANEGWTPDNLAANLDACARAGVTLVEQPLHADADAALADIPRSVPVCADESAHDTASLKALLGKYDAVNIKLDKTGGLTEALAMTSEAQRLGLMTMTGCMVATSLSMAPAILIAQSARFVDLDGPLCSRRIATTRCVTKAVAFIRRPRNYGDKIPHPKMAQSRCVALKPTRFDAEKGEGVFSLQFRGDSAWQRRAFPFSFEIGTTQNKRGESEECSSVPLWPACCWRC